MTTDACFRAMQTTASGSPYLQIWSLTSYVSTPSGIWISLWKLEVGKHADADFTRGLKCNGLRGEPRVLYVVNRVCNIPYTMRPLQHLTSELCLWTNTCICILLNTAYISTLFPYGTRIFLSSFYLFFFSLFLRRCDKRVYKGGLKCNNYVELFTIFVRLRVNNVLTRLSPFL